MKWLSSLEIPVTKICVWIKFSDLKFVKVVYLVPIHVYTDTSWRITGVKFLLPFSPDSITILKFATILPDTSKPPNMCYCGKCFDNNLEVAAHNSESHKDGNTHRYEGGGDRTHM